MSGPGGSTSVRKSEENEVQHAGFSDSMWSGRLAKDSWTGETPGLRYLNDERRDVPRETSRLIAV